MFKKNRNRNDTSDNINSWTTIVDGYVIVKCNGIIYDAPRGRTHYALPRGTTELSIAAWKAMRDTVEYLYVPSSIENFRICECGPAPKLKQVYVEDGVKKIDAPDLLFVPNLRLPENIIISERMRYKGVRVSQDGKLIFANLTTLINELSFWNCDSLKYAKIPGRIKNIPTYSFQYCHNLETFIMEDGVESMGYDALRNDFNLQVLEIPESFNGYIGLKLEYRNGDIAARKIGKSIDELMSRPMKIIIHRSGNTLKLSIPRGCIHGISIKENTVGILYTESWKAWSEDNALIKEIEIPKKNTRSENSEDSR